MVPPAVARLAQLRLRRRPDGGACSAAASRPSRSSPAASPTRCPSSTCCRCVLKRYEDDGKPANDRHIVALAAQNGLYRFQEAMRGTIDNFPVAPVRWLMRAVVFPLGAPLQAGARLARPQGRRAGADARRGARPAHALHLRLERRQRSDRPAGGDARQGGGRRGRREEARPRGARGTRCAACTAPTGSATPAKHGIITDGEAQLLREVEAAHRARDRRRPFRSGRGEAALHDGGA